MKTCRYLGEKSKMWKLKKKKRTMDGLNDKIYIIYIVGERIRK